MTIAQLNEDIKFLAERQLKAGSFGLSSDRCTGLSSNSIVAIAYGIISIEDQELPADISDMRSCERMWEKLPKHRKNGWALEAMKAARNCDYYGKED